MKELGFKLKEINEILQKPEYDKISAYKKQKELLMLKRNRTDRLIALLSRLEKGEQCMSFKEFDLTDYIEALERFKNNSTNVIIEHWGNLENFNLFIQKVKDEESEIAKLAIQQFGSIEKYTEAMSYNLEHFSEIMEQKLSGETKEIMQKSNDLYLKLTADMGKDAVSEEVQKVVHEIVAFTLENTPNTMIGADFWDRITETYSNDFVKAVTDAKYGAGASEYIVKALNCYFQK